MTKVEFSTFALFREQDLGHHAFILVIQQMAVKYRHAPDDRVGKVEDDVNGTAIRNIHGIQPGRMRERYAVFRIGQEMNLVYVERMKFTCLVDNTPMPISTDASARHRTRNRRILPAINIETVFVFCEGNGEVRWGLLQSLNVDRLVAGWANGDRAHLPKR